MIRIKPAFIDRMRKEKEERVTWTRGCVLSQNRMRGCVLCYAVGEGVYYARQ